MLVTQVVLSVSLMRIRVRHQISHPPALALKTYSPEILIWWAPGEREHQRQRRGEGQTR